MTYFLVSVACQHPGCNRAVRVAVRRSGTDQLGQFCQRHGGQLVRELNAAEAKRTKINGPEGESLSASKAVHA